MKELVPSPVERRLRKFNPPVIGRSGETARDRRPRSGNFRHAAMTRIGKHLQYASRVWERIRRALRDPYRPEQHYMRGPGPKNRAKASNAKAG